jgi:predicted TIM-barrel fold metal-dependent hydrolase
MLKTKIVDAHLHLSTKYSPDVNQAVALLDSELVTCGVARAVVLHLQAQPWSAEEFASAITAYRRLRAFININPTESDAGQQLRRGIEQLKFVGLKLHPRLQRFDVNGEECRRLVSLAGEMGIPVLIDAFPDGDWLMAGFDPVLFGRLANECARTRIIIGHFGGHHCIDFMMLAKRIPNIWFDLSYSLLYYRGSSVTTNLLYCCRSMNFHRILFGSDYPDRSLKDTLQLSMDVFTAHGLEKPQLDALLWRNAVEFFGWNDL